jgi:hydroxyacylglutathione hydrolase
MLERGDGSMFFRQSIDAVLGCASYVIADAGEAIVVDPSIAIDQYLELATRHRFGIVHIVETHMHADHVSGNCGSPVCLDSPA